MPVKPEILYLGKQFLNKFPSLRTPLVPLLGLRRIFLKKYLKRRVVERSLDSLFVEPVKLKVDEFEGFFFINPRSDLFKRLILNGFYEPVLSKLCRRLIDPGRDVIDIGANIGFFTVLSAKNTQRKVCAIEPTELARTLLRDNIKLNSVDGRVIVIQMAVSDTAGEVEMNVVEGKEEYSSVLGICHPSLKDGAIEKKWVSCMTIDQIVNQNNLDPGFVKIDVEGAEGKVFSGSSSMLEYPRPVVLTEFSPHLLSSHGFDPSVVLNMLSDKGYRLIDPIFPKIPPGSRDFGDLIAVPEEKFTANDLLEILAEAKAYNNFNVK